MNYFNIFRRNDVNQINEKSINNENPFSTDTVQSSFENSSILLYTCLTFLYNLLNQTYFNVLFVYELYIKIV